MNDTWDSWLHNDGHEKAIFRVEHPGDPDNVLTIAKSNEGRLIVSVSEEQAVDSYNQTFDCSIYLPQSVARKMAEAITLWLSKNSVESV